MDPATLNAGIAWEFETLPRLPRSGPPARARSLNFTAYIGHSAVRLYVMGDAAYERAATPDEIARMCALVREAIEFGAAGFSTSFSFAHRGVDGKPVPSRFAEADEVEALFLAAGEAGQGRGAHHAGQAVHLRRRVRVAAARRAAVHLPAVRGARRQAPRAGRGCTSRAGERRARCGPQVTPRPLTMQFTMADAYSLNTGTVFGELMKVSRDGAARGVPRSRVARAGRGRSRRLADEAALGNVRGVGVEAVPRAAGPPGRATSRASAARARST